MLLHLDQAPLRPVDLHDRYRYRPAVTVVDGTFAGPARSQLRIQRPRCLARRRIEADPLVAPVREEG